MVWLSKSSGGPWPLHVFILSFSPPTMNQSFEALSCHCQRLHQYQCQQSTPTIASGQCRHHHHRPTPTLTPSIDANADTLNWRRHPVCLSLLLPPSPSSSPSPSTSFSPSSSLHTSGSPLYVFSVRVFSLSLPSSSPNPLSPLHLNSIRHALVLYWTNSQPIQPSMLV